MSIVDFSFSSGTPINNALIKIKRGTRAQLNTAKTGNALNIGEPYLITDENRFAIGTAVNDYQTFTKSSELPFPEYTWSGKPSASTNAGAYIKISNIGVGGSIWYSNGTDYIPASSEPILLCGGGVPICIFSSGTIGNNGALSGITATAVIIDDCYAYFPAGAISAGSAAGFYYTKMSSTTAGTIYNNTFDPTTALTVPQKIANPTAFSTTGPGAYTQTTATDITTLSISIPAGLTGKYGILEIAQGFYGTSATQCKIKFDTTNVFNTLAIAGNSRQTKANITSVDGVCYSGMIYSTSAFAHKFSHTMNNAFTINATGSLAAGTDSYIQFSRDVWLNYKG